MSKLTVTSFNCKGFKNRNFNYISKLFSNCEVMLFQEQWLRSFEFEEFRKVLPDCEYVSKTIMKDDDIIIGRPYSGVAILWKNKIAFTVEIIPTLSQRLVAIMCKKDDVSIIVFCVYMPCNTLDNTEEFIDILTEIMSVLYTITVMCWWVEILIVM